jgi:hypothetical protein
VGPQEEGGGSRPFLFEVKLLAVFSVISFYDLFFFLSYKW